MAHWICEQCSIGFKADRQGDRTRRFCSLSCYHRWRRDNGITLGQFVKGHRTWNRGLKGIHLSPATEFREGHVSANKEVVGTVKLRRTKRDGRRRAWVKVAEPNKWELRAKVVWQEHYGSLPHGCVTHHRNRDTLDDSLTNLAVLTRAAHLQEHRHEFERKRKRRALLSRKRRSQRTKTLF